MPLFFSQVFVTLRQIVRDRVLHALLGSAVLLLLLVPAFSLFSMRQEQELAITLCLSATSLLLLVFTVLLGASSIWRDIEKKYVFSTLGMPLPRSSYLLGKFFGIALCIMVCVAFMAALSALSIHLAALQLPTQREILWVNVFSAFAFIGLKYILLAAVAVAFSSVATSFFIPIFGTLSVFLVGEASQDVLEYVTSSSAATLPEGLKAICQGLYYLLPNFEAFDLSVSAVYALPLDGGGLLLTTLYGVVYTALVLCCALWAFGRRELL